MNTSVKRIAVTDKQKAGCLSMKQRHVELIISNRRTQAFLGLKREQRELLCSAAFTHLLKPQLQINKTLLYFLFNLKTLKYEVSKTIQLQPQTPVFSPLIWF